MLRKAEALFTGSAEEIIILQAGCDVAIHKSDIGAALKRLRAIKPSSPSYRAARTAVAEISLTHRADRRAYLAAHLDIVETYKDYDAYVQCGDAFLRIQVRPCRHFQWAQCTRRRCKRTCGRSVAVGFCDVLAPVDVWPCVFT